MKTPDTMAELESIWEKADETHPLELARRFGASIRRLERLLDMKVPVAMIRHEQGVAERARMALAASGKAGLDAINEHFVYRWKVAGGYSDSEIAGNIEYFCRGISIDLEGRGKG